MPWARLDDKFHSHPTTWMVGLEANGLFARGLSYCADQLTDGFMPEQWVWSNVPSTQRSKDPRGIITKLEEAGLWERVEDGWHIADYLTYNPSRDEVLADRERRSEAGRKAAKAKWDKAKEDRDAA